MIKFLEQAKEKNNLIGIYTDSEDTSKYSVGYVEEIFEEGVLIFIITPDLQYEGIALLNLSLIYLLEYNTAYLNNMQKLIQAQNTDKGKLNFVRNVKYNLIEDFLKFCKENTFLVNIKHNYGFDLEGYIYELGDEVVVLDTYNEGQSPNGMTVLYMENINEVYIRNIV